MARLERQQIIALSEKTEAVYYDMEDELLVLIAEYLAQGENAYTIAELYNRIGQLSDEAIKIIAKYSKKSMAEVEEIMEEAMMIALDDIERQMQEAAKSGKLEKAPPLKQSQRVKNVVQSAARQSGQKMQQMQPTILNSVIVEYQEAVNDVVQEKQRIQQQNYDREIKYDPEDLEDTYKEAVYEITRDREITSKAIEKAIDKLADKGITGYVDSAGRHWQADTYATMVIRTNAHNVAIDATRERQADYGSDLFQISSHNGARELCYPYQGKICSWTSATGGSFIDGAGVKREYLSLENDTSYGEPAGIFGINCGHHPLPIIPGVSIVHEQPVQDPEENKREYEESQKQRYLERQIREAKRQYEMQRVSGADEETLKRYKQNIENKQQNMREFINDTGRTRRYDREKIQQQKFKVALFEGEIEPPKPLEAPLNVLPAGTNVITLGEATNNEKPKTLENYETKYEERTNTKEYKEFEKRVLDHANDNGLNYDFVEEGLNNVLNANEYAKAVDPETINLIAKDNKIKSLIETGKSGGTDNVSLRLKASEELYGSSKNLPKEEYENYGFLYNGIDNHAIGYGNAIIIFKKDNLAGRTTYTLGDSLDGFYLNHWGIAGDADNPSLAGISKTLSGATGDYNGLKELELWSKGEDLDMQRFHKLTNYFELQFHGKLTLDDIQEIILNEREYDDLLDEETIQILNENGIEITQIPYEPDFGEGRE